MAGDWIKMRGNLWDDPRVSRLCDLTEQTEAAVIGGLYWLWATADQHTEDGILPGLTLRQIDRKSGVPGLGKALCDIGWLVDHPEGVRILRFEEHNGASAKKRAVTAKRVANHRSGNADVTPAALQIVDHSVSGALAREEKSREEEEYTPQPPVAGGRVRPAAPEPEGFAEWWEAYRRKDARADALKAWRQLAPSEELRERMLAALRVWRWNEDRRLNPMPATWLRGRRWEDELVAKSLGMSAARLPAWCASAGFANIYEANNAGCYEHTAHAFRDGKRTEAA